MDTLKPDCDMGNERNIVVELGRDFPLVYVIC